MCNQYNFKMFLMDISPIFNMADQINFILIETLGWMFIYTISLSFNSILADIPKNNKN